MKLDDNEYSGFYIHSFMTGLGLKGTSLLIYALIFSFTVGRERLCFASRDYICACVGASKRSVTRALSALLEKGFILKKEIGDREGYATNLALCQTVEETVSPRRDGSEESSDIETKCEAESSGEDLYTRSALTKKAVEHPTAEGSSRQDEESCALKEKGVTEGEKEKAQLKKAPATTPKPETQNRLGGYRKIPDCLSAKKREALIEELMSSEDAISNIEMAFLHEYYEEGDDDPDYGYGYKQPKYNVRRYGRHGFVLMTREQFAKLLDLVCPDNLLPYVYRLELLIMKNIDEGGPHIRRHYRVLKKWIEEDLKV